MTTDPVAAPAAAVRSSTSTSSHCPYRQSVLLQQALSPDKMRVGFLLGAGCPVAIQVPTSLGLAPLIPSIDGLTNGIRSSIPKLPTHAPHFAKIVGHLDGPSPANIERILTRIRSLADVVGSGSFEGMSKTDLVALDTAICDEISKVMKVRLPAKGTPYHQLASWIGSIPRAHPVEVFTTNYDLLMEQALEECGVPYFDGFSGSDRTFFDVSSMEQHEKLPSRWARLWKIHGSVNWWMSKENEVQRRATGDADSCLMVHPTHLKYDQSRMMPYLAMLDRLRAFLARGQAVLVTCGYSFADWHINQAILQGLGGNPTAVCFGLLFGERNSAFSEIAKGGMRGNLRLLGVDGGVLGAVDQDWHSKQRPDHEFHGSAVVDGALIGRTTAPPERSKFLLGDFEKFGKFLAGNLAIGASGEPDA